jgi:hypothetical protein
MDNDQTTASEAAESREMIIPKKVVFAGLGVVVLLFLAVSGMLNRGYESKTITFLGIGRSSYGSGFGPKRFFLRKGQVFTADYSAEVERGGLRIHLSKMYGGLDPGTDSRIGHARLMHTGSGQLRVTVPETGVYRLWINGAPDRDGYKLSYKVSWRTE